MNQNDIYLLMVVYLFSIFEVFEWKNVWKIIEKNRHYLAKKENLKGPLISIYHMTVQNGERETNENNTEKNKFFSSERSCRIYPSAKSNLLTTYIDLFDQ